MHLRVRISYLVVCEDLSLNMYQKPKFKKVLDSAGTFSTSYNPPNRKIISKFLLDVINGHNIQRNSMIIKKESEILGLSFLGDGATITRTPLFKTLFSGVNILVSVL